MKTTDNTFITNLLAALEEKGFNKKKLAILLADPGSYNHLLEIQRKECIYSDCIWKLTLAGRSLLATELEKEKDKIDNVVYGNETTLHFQHQTGMFGFYLKDDSIHVQKKLGGMLFTAEELDGCKTQEERERSYEYLLSEFGTTLIFPEHDYMYKKIGDMVFAIEKDSEGCRTYWSSKKTKFEDLAPTLDQNDIEMLNDPVMFESSSFHIYPCRMLNSDGSERTFNESDIEALADTIIEQFDTLNIDPELLELCEHLIGFEVK